MGTNITFFNVVFLLVISIASISSECPKNWYAFDEHCYSFHGSYDKKYSWYAAQRLCQAEGANLASIHTEMENNFIQTKGKYVGGQHWIGLNSLNGDLKWTDESAVNFSNIEEERQYYTKKCYTFSISTGKWHLDHCGRLMNFICKMPFSDHPSPIPPVTTPTPIGNCQNGWYQFQGTCYKYFGSDEQDKKKWREARDDCRSLGPNSDIVSIHSMEEQMFLSSLMTYHKDHTWIGLSVLEATGKQYEWTDNSEKNFEYWAPTYPESGNYMECGYINSESLSAGQWMTDLCDLYKFNYICKSTPDPNISTPPPLPDLNTCDDSSDFNYLSSCYRYFEKPASWEEAEDICQRNGGHIVSINDPYEQAFLYTILDGNKDVWIGLSDNKYKIFHWANNWPVYYTNWNYGQPIKMADGIQRCVSMTDNALQWNATKCNEERSFLCEISKESPPDFPEDVTGHCPSGNDSWTDIGDEYCYYISQNSWNWGNSIKQCFTYDMDMISIHSEHVLKLLHSHIWKIRSNYWIGLIRTPDRDNFKWIDRSALDFVHWKKGEPSAWSKSYEEDCVQVSSRNGRWLPKKCSDFGGVICRVQKKLE